MPSPYRGSMRIRVSAWTIATFSPTVGSTGRKGQRDPEMAFPIHL